VSVLVLRLYQCFTSAVNIFLNFIILQEKRQTSYEYGRYGNPTSTVLEEKIRFVCLIWYNYYDLWSCNVWNGVVEFNEVYYHYWISELEGAESTILMASGMCASIVLLMALVPAGGHLVTTTDCYRKTRIFIETVLPKMGITVCDSLICVGFDFTLLYVAWNYFLCSRVSLGNSE